MYYSGARYAGTAGAVILIRKIRGLIYLCLTPLMFYNPGAPLLMTKYLNENRNHFITILCAGDLNI
jgi:hypothetical protein